MQQKLREPAAVPLNFLDWIKRGTDWLGENLIKQGVGSGFKISGPALEARTVEALRAVNRIRSFAFLAAPGLTPPYFDLSVNEPGHGQVRCVTLFPDSIAPGIGAMDFGKESFPASAANPETLKRCRVQSKKTAGSYGTDRDTFRKKFFDAAGDLKMDFENLNTDPAFIAQAIDHGFFVFQQDLTGRLRLDME
ncbi:MAG: hypothetical protein OEV99_18185 [Nitrospira sp.]|nr:hypothetical protein [Nitrospira sp.]